jgi:hemerythrin-like domain-containing protein
MQERGLVKDQGPIAVILHEHSMGRELIEEIESALKEYESSNQESSETEAKAMLRYSELLRTYIAKENNILFPMGDRLLAPDDQQFLEKAFKNVDEQEIDEDVHEKYHRMAYEFD